MGRIKPKDSKYVIYRATNKENGKMYIGQTKNFSERKYKHLIESLNTPQEEHRTYFHNAIRKYGEDAFIWDILEEYETSEKLDEREIHYIKILNTKMPNGYNSTDGGALSEDVARRISEAQKGNKGNAYGKKGKDSYHRTPVMNLTTGKKYDTIRELCIAEFGDISHVKYISRVISDIRDRDTYKGNRYCKLDPDTMEPLNTAPRVKRPHGNPNNPTVLKNIETGELYDSIADFCRKTGISDRVVRDKIYGITKTSKKYPILNNIIEVKSNNSANGETPKKDNTVPI